MVSEAQKTNSQSSSANANRGSLQVLNLGSLLVGQLAQAVNWSNDSAFKKPECKPWVDLPLVANVASTPQSTPEAVVADSAPVSVVSEESKSETGPTSVVEIKEPLVPDAAPAKVVPQDKEPTTSVHETATEKLSEPGELDSLAGEIRSDAVEISQEAPPAVAEASPVVAARSEDVTLEETPPPTVTTERSIAKAEIKVEEEPVAIVDKALDTSSELVRSQSKSEQETKLEPEPASKPKAMNAESKRVAIESADRENQDAARPALQKSRDTDRVRDPKPHVSQSHKMAERVSFAKSASMPARVDQSQDDYLLQLERLVVELNMELAQVRGEQTAVDPMEQMANRIIALNLENLALREKLQQSIP
jgi:hypothetical protein